MEGLGLGVGGIWSMLNSDLLLHIGRLSSEPFARRALSVDLGGRTGNEA